MPFSTRYTSRKSPLTCYSDSFFFKRTKVKMKSTLHCGCELVFPIFLTNSRAVACKCVFVLTVVIKFKNVLCQITDYDKMRYLRKLPTGYRHNPRTTNIALLKISVVVYKATQAHAVIFVGM